MKTEKSTFRAFKAMLRRWLAEYPDSKSVVVMDVRDTEHLRAIADGRCKPGNHMEIDREAAQRLIGINAL